MQNCSHKYDILKIRDKTDTYYTEIPEMFNIPFKLLITSKSQVGAGKTTILANLLANPKFPYHDKFDGDDIYIISNNGLDNKLDLLSKRMKIPDENRMEYDEEMLEVLYEELEEQFNEAVDEGEKPSNKLLIFDDVGYSGSLKDKQAGIISKILCNGRHANISTNLTGAIFGAVPQRDLELIADDFNMMNHKKDFIKLFRENTKGKRDFLVINFTDDRGLYFDKLFQPLVIKDK